MTTTPPPLTEAQFQQQITELADIYGWEWMHPRAGRTKDSWRTPMSGPLGQGFPDLLLIKGGRLIFMEVKRSGGKTTDAQNRVLDVLMRVAETYVVRPEDWPFIEKELSS